jgi:hypothetical protein
MLVIARQLGLSGLVVHLTQLGWPVSNSALSTKSVFFY